MSRTATDIYNQQNKIIHRALAEMGMPYRENKTDLCGIFADVLGRRHKIKGLSSLTLGERHRMIKYLRSKGVKAFNPFIGRHLWKWKKTQPDQTITGKRSKHEPGRPLMVAGDNQPLVGKIHALLADMKLPWSYADGIAMQMHGVDIVEWCEKTQLVGVVSALVVEQKKQEIKIEYSERNQTNG